MTQQYDNQLIQWLQLSGEYIGGSHTAEDRAGWILFLLEQVKPFVTAEEYNALLNELQQRIAAELGKA
jgi:hypothetical protein